MKPARLVGCAIAVAFVAACMVGMVSLIPKPCSCVLGSYIKPRPDADPREYYGMNYDDPADCLRHRAEFPN